MVRLPRVSGKEIERALFKAGWYLHHSKGSHFYYKHPDRIGVRVDIPMHAGEVLAPKTLKSILEYAGLSIEEFIQLMRG